MKELAEIRTELDQVDRSLVAAFEARMNLCRQVAEYKITHGMQVLDASREEQVLASREALVRDAALRPAVRELYQELMSLSRREQQRMVEEAEKSC